MEGLATLLQKIYRGWKAYSRFQEMRDSAIIIETRFRGYKVSWGGGGAGAGEKGLSRVRDHNFSNVYAFK